MNPCGAQRGSAPPPDLHAFAPGAHVLAQQQVVEGDGAHDVELLLDHLLDELGVGAVLAHGGVEGVELPQDGVQREGAFVGDAGGPLAQAGGLHPRHALNGLVLQHAGHCGRVGGKIRSVLGNTLLGSLTLFNRGGRK